MTRIILRLAFAAAAVLGPAPRQDAWKVIGPGGGGTMIEPTISPHDPNIVLEHCDMTGGYITLDGARSWRMFNLGSGINQFAFDPKNPAVLYAVTEALWRSEDTGKTWRMIYPAKGVVEHLRGDHAEISLTANDPSYPNGLETIAVKVDPSDSNRLYLIFRGDKGSWALFQSNDRGVSWSRSGDVGTDEIRLLHVDGASVYAIGASGVHVWNGISWQNRAGPGETIVHAAAAANKFYVTTGHALFTSEDGGQSWRKEKVFESAAKLLAIGSSEHHPQVAYLGFEGLQLSAGRENLFNGIAKTSDGGRNWTIVHKESSRHSSNLEGSWIENFIAKYATSDIWFDTPWSLGVAPNNPEICYATDLFRTYRTTDGGKTWQQVNSVRVAEDRWTTRGLDVTTSYGVHFDPFDARHVFISYTDISLFQSSDGGASWLASSAGVPNKWRNTAYWIEFDPDVRGRMWGAFSGTHDLPRPKMWRNRDPEKFRGGVAISTDGGRTWTPSNNGMPETAVTHILLDPKSKALYACGFGRGVYKSTDGAKTWALANTGIEGKQPFAWRLTRAADGTLYLVVARRDENGDGALYASKDSAAHWTKIRLPDGVTGPNGLALNNDRMYLSAWGIEKPGGDTGGGVFLSTDGGGTWRNIFKDGQHVYDLTVDRSDLYICGFDGGAYRSTDAGASWTRIRGYNFKWGHRVVADASDPKQIYITTFGGSVWHGPAEGDQRALEDVVNPPERKP